MNIPENIQTRRLPPQCRDIEATDRIVDNILIIVQNTCRVMVLCGFIPMKCVASCLFVFIFLAEKKATLRNCLAGRDGPA